MSDKPVMPGTVIPRTFVLVHGAWHGGWCWVRVAERLRAAGHRVFTPTLTGLGERRHLLSREITLDTFGTDIANVIEAEELDDVMLVGHSFAGLPISIVAERKPERIRHLVYLDAFLMPPGTCVFDELPADKLAARMQLAEETSGGLSLPHPPATFFGVTDPDDLAWMERHLTPHPLGTYLSPFGLKHAIGNGLPRTYIDCTEPRFKTLDPVKAWLRNEPGWGWLTLQSGHNPMITMPDELSRILVDLAEV